MMKETCYGIIPLIQQEGKWKLLLIKHRRDAFWGFPKGHAEAGEDGFETACRELYEETHLKVLKKLFEMPLIEKYSYQKEKMRVDKEVYFYLAITTDQVLIDQVEVIDFKWCSIEEAFSLISFKEGKELISSLKEKLKM